MKTMINKAVSCITLLTAVYASAATAQWQVNEQSSAVSLVASKNVHTSEVFTFKRVSGAISDSGALSIKLDLASIDSKIGIRDERMKEHLFEVAKFPHASITSQLEQGVLDKLKSSVFLQTSVTASLDLHGLKRDVQLDLNVMSSGDKLLVSARQPVLINSDTFGLGGGLAKLAELAGGISISQTTVVNFSLVFDN